MEKNIWLIISSIFKLAIGIITLKALTYFLDPKYFYISNQVQSLLQIYATVAAAIASAKLSSQISTSPQNKNRISVAFTAILAICLAILLANSLMADMISSISGLKSYKWIVFSIPITTLFVALHTLQGAIFTGEGNHQHYSASMIASTFIGCILITTLTCFLSIHGTLIAITISPIISYIALNWLGPYKTPKITHITIDDLKDIGIAFALIGMLSGASNYIIHFIIKAEYAKQTSESEAGLYATALRISEIYMSIFAVLFANQLTKIFGEASLHELKNKSIESLAKSLPALMFAFILIAFSANTIIPIIAGPNYQGAGNHLIIICIADFMKCIYWFNAYRLIRENENRKFLAIEITGQSLLLFLATTNPFKLVTYIPEVGLIAQAALLLILSSIVCRQNNKKYDHI